MTVSRREASKTLRQEIKALLESGDYGGITGLTARPATLIRHLIPFTYDKGEVLCWRAIEAIGRVTALMPTEEARSAIQRVLWMMRDESGGNVWSGAEIIGEMVRTNPGPYEDIVPVLISFHEEALFRTGTLWAMARIAEVRADLVEPLGDVPLGYVDSPEPALRGLALMALGRIGKERFIPIFEKRLKDKAPLLVYSGGSLVRRTVGDIAAEALSLAKGPRP
jgi:HEAT repeat protein